MIHFFPGLFSSREMWSPYKQLGKNQIHDLNALPKNLDVDDILVGYSMGGRLALKLASDCKFHIKKLILLSSHPGLNPTQKEARRTWEDTILQKMDSLDSQSFFDFWDKLEIFSKSKSNRNLSKNDFLVHRKLFDQNRLSQQKNYWPDLISNKDKITYIYGKDDIAYFNIAQEFRAHSISCYEINSDHRVYLKQEELISILEREIAK